MRTLTSIALVVTLVVGFTPSANAQTQHAAPASALDAAVQDHMDSSAADREMVLRLLARPEVQSVAGDAGIDLRRAETAVAALDGAQLAEVAAHAQQVEQALAGGQSRVTISTTLIIIALLVLILIIVAVD